MMFFLIKEIILILFQLNQIPVVLGQWGTIIISILGTLSVAMNGWLLYRSQTTSVLKESIGAYKGEMDILKIKLERIEGELNVEKTLNATLQAKTDLSSVMGLLTESLELTRAFHREQSNVVSSSTEVLKRLLESDTKNNEVLHKTISDCGFAISELRDEIREDRKETAESFSQVSSILSKIIDRVTEKGSNYAG